MDAHGGNLHHYNKDNNKILNFAGNVNPLDLTDKLIDVINEYKPHTVYPDEQYTDLRKSIAKYIKGDYETILVGNGATELISLLISTLMPKNTLNIKPAYSEYEKELKKVNSNIIEYFLEEDNDFNIEDKMLDYAKGCDLIIFCNPNNPTGTFIKNEKMKSILTFCKQNKINVLIDETYAEFTREHSAVNLISEFDNLFVIRGASKFFGVCGLRLGYLVSSNSDITREIHSKQLLWNVNSIAEVFLTKMFCDEEFIQKTLTHTENELLHFSSEIGKINTLKMYPTYSNFFVVKILDDKSSYEFHKYCLENGALIRDLTYYGFKKGGEKFFRVSVLEREDNEYLLNLINRYFG